MTIRHPHCSNCKLTWLPYHPVCATKLCAVLIVIAHRGGKWGCYGLVSVPVLEILSGWAPPKLRSRLQLDMRNLSLGRRHLVNAYEVEAGIGVIAGNTVWSMPERLECEVLQKARYINTLTFYLYLLDPVWRRPWQTLSLWKIQHCSWRRAVHISSVLLMFVWNVTERD